MSEPHSLRFYATTAHPCSYLEGQEATTIFVEPDAAISDEQIVKLTESGFRRSGRYIYRPHCENCSACISVRVPVETFEPKRRQIRTLKKNQDVIFSARTPVLDNAHYELYRRYIEARHPDGDMFPPSPSQYESFLAVSKKQSFFLEAKIEDQLIAVTYFDEIPNNGLSAIYTFFDPDPTFDPRSLGRLMVLQLLKVTQSLKLPYLYLGYWIRDSKKMAYKTEYGPIEMLKNSKWIRAN
ncbi:arginyltransferase [Litorivicinus sp.]|nr:arginyltransferase [Litorivicinus sp.]